MIYFYTVNFDKGYRTHILYLKVRGQHEPKTIDKIRRHIQDHWVKGRSYLMVGKWRGDKRVPRGLHPEYEAIAMLAEFRFPLIRGKTVRYWHYDFKSYDYVASNLMLERVSDHLTMLDARKKFKVTKWSIRYSQDNGHNHPPRGKK